MVEDSLIPTAWDDIDGVVPPSMSLNLVGHGSLVERLCQNYRAKRLHHAWLLAGPRGIGKATLAYRFAEYLLRHPDPITAPGEVTFADDPVHSQVSKGVHPNILVLRKPWDQKTKKFKTQVTVDEIRKIGAFLQTASGANAWRIVIVDPADDMNASAANALLKMLEEPPARTLFFILAHSPRGLLPTIRSRCQLLTAKSLGDDDLKSVLGCQPLTQSLNGEETDHLVRHARGSARRALLLAHSGVLETWNGFVDLIRSRKPDIGGLHRLAGQLAPAAKSAEYALFMDLVYDHLAETTRDMATNDQIAMDRLAAMADVWDKTRESAMRADTWNMDKKQVILDLYRDLRSL